MTESPTYLTGAETSKIVRAALAKAFPGVKFSVRTARGDGTRVRWTDGPVRKAVEAVVNQFDGDRFDGSVDFGWSVSHWLLPDGSAIIASDQGSARTGGYCEAIETARPCPKARLVRFSGVSCSRDTSPELMARVGGWIARHGWQSVQGARFPDDAPWILAGRATLQGSALVMLKGAHF